MPSPMLYYKYRTGVIFILNNREFFQKAQICTNGHMRNSCADSNPNRNESFCALCGAAVIDRCPSCKTPIRGCKSIEQPRGTLNGNIFSKRRATTTVTGYAILTSNDAPVPAFCHQCGAPYPWTEATLKTAENIINMLDELTEDQKKQLVNFIPDIIVETPQSRYAALVYAKFLDGLQGLAVDCFKNWAKENVLPVLLVLMNMKQ